MVTIAKDFWKCVNGMRRRSIDKGPLIELNENTSGRGTAGLMLLKRYYQAIERNPNTGVFDTDVIAIKHQSTVDGKIECQYCGYEAESSDITLDHFVPRYMGGISTFSNLKLCCSKCNSMKGSIHHEKMPHTWSLFQRNLKDKVHVPALALLVEAKKEQNLSDREKHLVQKLEKKEREWRSEKGKTLKGDPVEETSQEVSQKAA